MFRNDKNRSVSAPERNRSLERLQATCGFCLVGDLVEGAEKTVKGEKVIVRNHSRRAQGLSGRVDLSHKAGAVESSS